MTGERRTFVGYNIIISNTPEGRRAQLAHAIGFATPFTPALNEALQEPDHRRSGRPDIGGISLIAWHRSRFAGREQGQNGGQRGEQLRHAAKVALEGVGRAGVTQLGITTIGDALDVDAAAIAAMPVEQQLPVAPELPPVQEQ